MKLVESNGLLETEGGLLQDDNAYAAAALSAVSASQNAAKERREHGKSAALQNREEKLASLKKDEDKFTASDKSKE